MKKILLISLLLIKCLVLSSGQSSCGVNDADYNYPNSGEEIFVYANYVNPPTPELIGVVQAGETLNLSIVDGTNFLLGGTQEIASLVFTTNCRSASLNGSTQVCELLGGAGNLCSTTFECIDDFHVWEPPSIVSGNCQNITITLPDIIGELANITVNISYVIVIPSCEETLSLDGTPIPSDIYEASSTITASGTINNGGIVEITAGGSVILEPGFHAMAGSICSIYISDCGTTSSPLIESNATFLIPRFHNNNFTIQPNPFSQKATLHFQLHESSQVELSLYDSTGKLVKKFYEGINTPMGNHEIEINTINHSLDRGIYFITLRVNETLLTKKIVVL